MTFTLNEPGLRTALETEAGMVGVWLRARAEEVAEAARVEVGVIMHRMPGATGLITSEILTDPSLRASIGVDGIGRISRYLAAKNTTEGWLFKAARTVFPSF